MDGIALKAEDTFGTTIDRPKQFQIGREAFWINTGQPMPAGTNAVIMVEQVLQMEGDRVELQAAAYPWQYVRKMGEDLVATELLLPQGHRITAYDLGALIAGGVFEIWAVQKPKVVLIPTGSELVEWDEVKDRPLPPGKVPEYNTLILSGLVHECGGESIRWPIVQDEKEFIREALAEALTTDSHMVIVNAGLRPAAGITAWRPLRVWEGSGPRSDHHARKAHHPGNYSRQAGDRQSGVPRFGHHLF